MRTAFIHKFDFVPSNAASTFPLLVAYTKSNMTRAGVISSYLILVLLMIANSSDGLKRADIAGFIEQATDRIRDK